MPRSGNGAAPPGSPAAAPGGRLADQAPSERQARPRFSVVIPALDEARTLPETLARLNVCRRVQEVIVCDGGSRDATVRVAQQAGARVVHAEPGRGPQMNTGAGVARCDHLLFLHADCRLPHDAFAAIDRVLASGRDAGLFRIDFGDTHPLLRSLSRLSHWPSRWTQFGEGALFVRRARFEAVGGFPDWPLMEDVELLRCLRAIGHLGSAEAVVRASPRRFREHGVWRQFLRNITCWTLFQCGVAPQRLLRFYGGAPAPTGEPGTLRRRSRGCATTRT